MTPWFSDPDGARPMSLAARSLFYFGLWMALLGGALVAVPNRLLGLFGGAPTEEGWVRIVGTLTVLIAYCCVQSGRQECREFFRWSVVIRYWVVVSFSYHVMAGYGDPVILIVAAIDFVSATGTLIALRIDAARATARQRRAGTVVAMPAPERFSGTWVLDARRLA